MPNLHFACDFVFDVTRSLLIMQWTRREYARTTAPPPFLARRPPSEHNHRAHVLLFSLLPFALPFLSFFLFLFVYLFIYLFIYLLAIRSFRLEYCNQSTGSSCVSFRVDEFSLLRVNFESSKWKRSLSGRATLRIRVLEERERNLNELC